MRWGRDTRSERESGENRGLNEGASWENKNEKVKSEGTASTEDEVEADEVMVVRRQSTAE